jgi:hypothetical protein
MALCNSNEEPPAGAETVLASLDEADAGEDKVAVVADDDAVAASGLWFREMDRGWSQAIEVKVMFGHFGS